MPLFAGRFQRNASAGCQQHWCENIFHVCHFRFKPNLYQDRLWTNIVYIGKV